MVPHHAPAFRCVRRCRAPAPSPASSAWSPFSGVPLTESEEFKEFVKKRHEAREKRKKEAEGKS